MSILLEALRKSEKKPGSREVPTIHTDVPSSQPDSVPRLAVLVVLLAMTFAVSAWFVWQQYLPPEGEALAGGQVIPPVSSQPVDQGRQSGPAAPVEAESTGSSPRASETPAAATLVTGENPGSADTPVQSNPAPPRPRTPMENYQPPDLTAAVVAQQEAARNQPPPAKGEPDVQVPAPRQAVEASSVDEPVAAGEDRKPAVQTASKPHEPEPIGYWELPDAIRADVPEIKYSVLVYDKNPSRRFVLINGERFAEGDSYQPGLVVKEIRRDGVIFTYRLYRFLVER